MSALKIRIMITAIAASSVMVAVPLIARPGFIGAKTDDGKLLDKPRRPCDG